MATGFTGYYTGTPTSYSQYGTGGQTGNHFFGSTTPTTSTYTIPPPSTNYTLPPPPPLPQLPPQTNTFLPQLQALLAQFGSVQPFSQLSPDVANLLATQKQAALAGFEDTKNNALDQQLASLFGRGVERSSIAADEATRLASTLGAQKAAIEGNAAAQQLAAMQYAGQFGLNSLGQQAGIAGQGAGLEQNAYSQLVNALLGQGSLANQQYATQAGNTLQQQQLAQQYQAQQQQYALQQQQMLMSLLSQFGGLGGFGLGGGSLGGGGTSGSYYGTGGGYSGYTGGGIGGPTGYGTGTYNAFGQWIPTQLSNQTQAIQSQGQIQQAIANWILQLIQNFGG